MSTKYPQGIITPTPPFKSTTAQSFSGVWTLEQLANNFYYYRQAVQKSLRFRSSASAYLNRTPASAGNRQTWTWSGWVKRGALGATQVLFEATDATGTSVRATNRLTSGDALDGSDSSSGLAYTTTQVFRDPSAWYHIVVAMDTTQAVAANRFKLYINGTQVTSFSAITYPTLNASTLFNSTSYFNYIGATRPAFSQYFDGYMAEINFIDGQALDPSYFGQISPITGVWSPAPYTGTYGTNGFYLKFSDTTSTTTLCYDYSGNSNNWTPNNISLTAGSTYDSMLDSPTNYDNGGNGVGNYAVLNPLYSPGLVTTVRTQTIGNGNLYAYATSNSEIAGTIAVSSGKWYYEVFINNSASNDGLGIGVANLTTKQEAIYRNDSPAVFRFAGTQTSYGSTFVTNDIVGVAIDLDNTSITFYVNNVSQGVAKSNLPNGSYVPYFLTRASFGNTQISLNFGQRPFAYTPPTGYKALNTQNLPTPSIQNGSNFMAATLYTGNGATQNIINANNSVSFQPDFVWIKSRSAATDHALYDVIRGTQNRLESNTTDAAVASDNGLTAFGSAGFTVNTLAQVNTNAATYVGWQWKAGGTAVTNTSGSITSQVSANTTAGFSVVTYTGTGANATVGHGLGVAPSFIICKARGSQGTSSDWACYHVALGATNRIWLNLTNATAANIVYWNNTAPTSSVFSLGTEGTVNTNSNTNVAYCFAAIAGYSAFGSYTGNGSADGPFVYCGFRPRWVLIKNTSGANVWVIYDTARDVYNVAGKELYPNLPDAEFSSTSLDMISNGFKIRSTSGGLNANANVYIYAAFAENPFNYSLAR